MDLPILDKLRKELKQVEYELTVAIPKALQEAVALGDISDSGDYESAKERQRLMEARGNQLRGRIRELSMIKLDNIPDDAVGFGSEVTLEKEDDGLEVTYVISTAEEAESGGRVVSYKTPIAKALIGLIEDEEVPLRTLPAGTGTWYVKSFKTIHERLNEE
ncbi:GreA/GreB family elongation factor [bacterium]|nr:GreA/GreB family elongation factor [candidate division CSSED10-310 bacterium]